MTPSSDVTPHTPVQQTNQIINDLLRQLNANDNTPTEQGGSSSPVQTDSQLQLLLQCCRQQQAMIAELTQQRSASSSNNVANIITPAKAPDYYNNARYEDIICKPVKPAYDGSADQLVPFLNRLN
jgi:hypothetical protein